MKITDVKVTPLCVPLEAPVRWSWGALICWKRILVQVFTDEGLVGLGETYGDVTRLAVLEACRPVVIGEDPFNVEALRWKIAAPGFVLFYGNSYTAAAAAIELACLDIQGKATGRPVHDLLGGKVRDRIPFIAYLRPRFADERGGGAIESPDDIVAFAHQMVKRYGFQTLKLKGGVFPPEQEVETMSALRTAFPHHRLRIDPNGAWSVPTAIRVARKLEECDLEWLEDPVFGQRAMAELRKRVPRLTLATNMCVFNFEDLPAATAYNPVDVLLCDIHAYGGLRQVMHLARFCEAFGFDMGMHSWDELGVALAAMLHLGAAVPNLTRSHALDAGYHHLRDDIIKGGKMQYDQGGIAVPTGPGLGVELDEDKVALYHEMALKVGLDPFPQAGSVEQMAELPVLPRW